MTRPNIVVADGFTTNPGDLSWDALAALGTLVVHERAGAQLREQLADADVVLTNKAVLDAALLGELPRLGMISVLATGTNVVDLAAARERGIVVCNVPAYSTASVVQHTLSLLLELTNRTGDHHRAAVDGRWAASGDFSFRLRPIEELHGLTAGVIGFGAIGQGVVRAFGALGMRCLVVDRPSARAAASRFPDVELVPLEVLLRRADVVSLHCPLTSETSHLINDYSLSLMKAGALLLNTGRGGLVDEVALARALQAGSLRGAGLDVLNSEPPAADCPLLQLPECIVTPHLAWASVAARQRLIAQAAANVQAWLRGEPIHRVA